MYQNFLNSLRDHTGILLRFDDIAPNMNWKMMDRCERILNEYKIKPVVGVIPNNQDTELLSYEKRDEFWQIVKHWQNNNWTVAMHGYTHVYDSETRKKDYFKYGGKSEFFGHSYEHIDNEFESIPNIEKNRDKYKKMVLALPIPPACAEDLKK